MPVYHQQGKLLFPHKKLSLTSRNVLRTTFLFVGVVIKQTDVFML